MFGGKCLKTIHFVKFSDILKIKCVWKTDIMSFPRDWCWNWFGTCSPIYLKSGRYVQLSDTLNFFNVWKLDKTFEIVWFPLFRSLELDVWNLDENVRISDNVWKPEVFTIGHVSKMQNFGRPDFRHLLYVKNWQCLLVIISLKQ